MPLATRMIAFTARILKFQKKGEKTGWSYITVSRRYAEKLKPNSRVSFRVKGRLDQFILNKTALIPMGDGNFILPLNAALRKAIGKGEGDSLIVELELDNRKLQPSKDFIRCLKDEPNAFRFFKSLPMSYQNYFHKWIDSAKTIETKSKRIALAVSALDRGHGFPEMLRANRKP